MQIAGRLAELGIGHVHAGGADHLGVWRAKRVSAETAGRGKLGFSDGVFGLDIAGEWAAPPADHRGWYPRSDAGYPDMLLALDPATAVVYPWLDGEAWVVGDWLLPDGSPLSVCPRGGLRRTLATLEPPPPTNGTATSCPAWSSCRAHRQRWSPRCVRTAR